MKKINHRHRRINNRFTADIHANIPSRSAGVPPGSTVHVMSSVHSHTFISYRMHACANVPTALATAASDDDAGALAIHGAHAH